MTQALAGDDPWCGNKSPITGDCIVDCRRKYGGCIIPVAKRIEELMVKKPKATHYTLHEGGEWFPWKVDCFDAGDIFAVLFEDGWIWDSKIGWRKPV